MYCSIISVTGFDCTSWTTKAVAVGAVWILLLLAFILLGPTINRIASRLDERHSQKR